MGDNMLEKKKKTKTEDIETIPKNCNNPSNKSLVKSMEDNISLIKNIFKNDETLIVRRFHNKRLADAKCCVIYLDGMVNSKILNENIIQPILRNDLTEDISWDELLYKVIVSNNVQMENDINSIVSRIAYGDTLLLLEKYDKGLVISSKGWQTRAITEPESERVIRGPREGFTESIMMNISLIRRKIRTPDLKIKFKEIGERTHTKTCICYIEGIAASNILRELEKRLDEIDIDGILDSGYIQELIRDAPFSPFETIGSTERPDVVAGKLLEGRIALIVDGSPVVLTVPFIGAEMSQSSEDYYNNYIFSSVNRLLRSIAVLTAVTVPAIFVSMVTFHQEILPTPLLLSISASRQGVPFPTVLSMLLMLLVFDLLREAGTRMPAPIGQAINIVGTLVLGQTAVEAKLVSAPVVIVTALTGILILMNTKIIGAVIVFRNIMLLAAAILGIYGVIFAFILLFLHLMSIRSFGVPYMINITTARYHNGQDAWIRAPWWSMTLRPKIIAARNLVRQSGSKNRRNLG